MDLFEEKQQSPAANSPQKDDPMAFMAPAAPVEDSPQPSGGMDAFEGMGTSLDDVPVVLDEQAMARIKEWEAQQEEKCNKLAQQELHSKKQKREASQKDLTQFYVERKERMEKKKAVNRKDEKDWKATQENAGSGKNPWEQVLSMIPDVPVRPDLAPYQDTTRFKQVLIQLKATSVAN